MQLSRYLFLPSFRGSKLSVCSCFVGASHRCHGLGAHLLDFPARPFGLKLRFTDFSPFLAEVQFLTLNLRIAEDQGNGFVFPPTLKLTRLTYLFLTVQVTKISSRFSRVIGVVLD